MGKKEPVCLCYIEQAADETIEMMLVVQASQTHGIKVA